MCDLGNMTFDSTRTKVSSASHATYDPTRTYRYHDSNQGVMNSMKTMGRGVQDPSSSTASLPDYVKDADRHSSFASHAIILDLLLDLGIRGYI